MPKIKSQADLEKLRFSSNVDISFQGSVVRSIDVSPTGENPPVYTSVLSYQTDKFNFRFGNDRPGYGSSGLPYVQTTIPADPNSPGTFSPIYDPTSTGGLDFPIRGGGIKISPGQSSPVFVSANSETASSRRDFYRINRFLNDAPRGPAFIEKQIGLQLTNPKIETGNVLFGLAQSAQIPGILENTRVYNNGKNTLAQVLASGTGAHALRHGLVPFALQQQHYYATVNLQNTNNDPKINRLVNLTAIKMTSSTSPFTNPSNIFDINLINNLGISLNKSILFQYLGGPGSSYGIGTTTIKRVSDTTRVRNTRVMGYDQLYAQSKNKVILSKEGYYTKETNIQDFRTQAGLNSNALPYVGWTDVSGSSREIEKRFFTVVTDKKNGKKADKLNTMLPFIFENKKAPWEIEKYKDSDDLVKFVFEAVDNNNADFSTAIFFRALLNSGITDNNSAQLSSFKYMGRGESFYTYQGFERSISFSFRVYASSGVELKPMYNRINALISQVYPDYSDSGIMRAPLMRVTIGDYMYRMPGFLESVNVTVDNSYPWELNLQKDPQLAQLPQVLDVSVSFKPILAELPRRLGSSIIKSQVTEDEATVTTTNTLQNNKVPKIIANIPGNDEGSFIQTSYDSVVDYTQTQKREINNNGDQGG